MTALAGRSVSASRSDLVLLLLGVVLFAIFSVAVELNEWVWTATRAHERLQLDELPGILLVAALGLAWYAWRRVRDARSELTRRQAAEMRLTQALAENRELVRAGLCAQELQQRDLARELHDELGQYLNAIQIDAVMLRDGTALDRAAVRTLAATIVAACEHTQLVVRDMMRRLRPVGLDELGLAAALGHCVDGWRRRLPAIRFSLRIAEDLGDFDEATNMTLYRLVQEGLTNVARHARASHVEIELGADAAQADGPPQIVLSLHDDGVGRPPHLQRQGMGLLGMRERVEALAGAFALHTAPGRGFGFVACLPLPGSVGLQAPSEG